MLKHTHSCTDHGSSDVKAKVLGIFHVAAWQRKRQRLQGISAERLYLYPLVSLIKRRRLHEPYMQLVACTSAAKREAAYVTQSGACVHRTEPEAWLYAQPSAPLTPVEFHPLTRIEGRLRTTSLWLRRRKLFGARGCVPLRVWFSHAKYPFPLVQLRAYSCETGRVSISLCSLLFADLRIALLLYDN